MRQSEYVLLLYRVGLIQRLWVLSTDFPDTETLKYILDAHQERPGSGYESRPMLRRRFSGRRKLKGVEQIP